MALERGNVRTWLLVAVAGWALVVWALSLAGLGGRIERLDADAEPLPVVIGPGAPDAGPQAPLASFADVGNRPLFTTDRRPQPFFIDPQDEGEGSTGFDYVLTSVLQSPDFSMAILQPSEGGESVRLKIGEAPPAASNWVLGSVDTRSVVFNGPEGPRTLVLRVYDGTGGQAPTPMTAPPADGARAEAGGRERGTSGAAEARPAAAANTADNASPQRQSGAAARTNATAPAPAPQQAATGTESAGYGDVAPAAGPSQSQVEAIRKRIEARRAQLRQQQASPQTQP